MQEGGRLRFCVKLVSLGYESEFRVLDAAQYGVPQRRRRMILLASRAARLSDMIAQTVRRVGSI